MPNRKLAVMGSHFNPEAWKASVYTSLEGAIRAVAFKAMESAIEDAPVRSVFKRGTSGRRRGLRTRKLSRIEAFSEVNIRQKLRYRNKDGKVVPMASALPGVTRTRGRSVSDEPFYRRAAKRSGNPNSFQPFVLAPAGVDEDGVRVPERRGGRETEVVAGKRRLKSATATEALDARGRYELRTGRAQFKGKKTSAETLGGRLRGEIKLQGPYRIGSVIKARVLSPTPYAKFQEFGTRHNRATPYMRPAIMKAQQTFRRDIVKAINRAHGGRPDAGNF